MAISIKTTNSSKLLSDVRAAITAKKVTTWRFDADGDFTHSPSQWDGKAWLRPTAQSTSLDFAVIPTKDIPLTDELAGVIQGRFSEMLLGHFKTQFTSILLTP
jgi:hypothetical protein